MSEGTAGVTRYQVSIQGKLWAALRVLGALDGLSEGVLEALEVTEKRYGRGTRVTVCGSRVQLRELLAVIQAETALGPARDLGVEAAELRRTVKQALRRA